MSTDNNVVERILSLLDNVELPYPGGPLLTFFVSEALNPVQAAHYLNQRILTDEPSFIVADWAYIILCITENACSPPQPDRSAQNAITLRDRMRCCVTGKNGTFWDPLLVMPILPIPSGWDTQKTHISDMLGAFFGPQYRDWWLFYIRNAERIGPYANHCLIRRSIADSFALGFIRLDRLQPSLIEYEVRHVLLGSEEPIPLDGAFPLLGDHSQSGTEKIDPRFIGTHARLCKSIRYFELTKKFAADRLPCVSGSLICRSLSYFFVQFQQAHRGILSITGHLTRVFGVIWSLFPAKFRLAGYNVLRRLGERLYGKSNGYSTVQRLPFGLYLKFQGEVDWFCNEFNALRVVRRFTSIPVPHSLDLAIKPVVSDDPFSTPEGYLLTTRLPVNPEMAICNTVGEACHDPRIQGGQQIGPFKDEAAFNQTLRYSGDAARRGHKIVFTHADLNPRNILVDRMVQPDGSRGWKVTGIVDWETSGYYPEYWDYTKAMFEGFRGF
ncbi:hypothetical protein EYB26_009335 [Talaromyces marneffei]|uniref:uncharacterized protein n=1 Tax=Talaromyces marneffei TaxID=37727 RepID=UPI0012AA38B8|nr:uncharacterized protein EYB26_009335 [Talaromyces marneffei]QGA21624.1 hypothetical protein EYB26_009335 [Talaromyces marneffei]